MAPEVLSKIVEQLLLAGIIGAIALGVKQLQAICHELTALKVTLAVLVEQVKDHDRRIVRIETVRDA